MSLAKYKILDYEYSKPLCRILVSDKPLNGLLDHFHSEFLRMPFAAERTKEATRNNNGASEEKYIT